MNYNLVHLLPKEIICLKRNQKYKLSLKKKVVAIGKQVPRTAFNPVNFAIKFPAVTIVFVDLK